MNRRDGEPDRLRAFVNGEDWATVGYQATESESSASAAIAETV